MEEGGRIVFGRRDFRTAGQRRETNRDTYHGKRRSLEKAGSGWRSRGFGIGGHEAYDAELAALAYGLVHLHGRGMTGQTCTAFTDSRAAMIKIVGDAPGPGQEMAIRIIELARRIIDQGNYITIRWTPAHRGLEGNERAD